MLCLFVFLQNTNDEKIYITQITKNFSQIFSIRKVKFLLWISQKTQNFYNKFLQRIKFKFFVVNFTKNAKFLPQIITANYIQVVNFTKKRIFSTTKYAANHILLFNIFIENFYWKNYEHYFQNKISILYQI